MAAAAFRTRPTPVGRSIPAEFPSQIGRGEAQLVPKGDLSAIIAGQQQRRAAEQQQEAAKKERLEKQLDLSKPNILPRDEKRYNQMNTDLRKYWINNVNNMDNFEVRSILKQKIKEVKGFGLQSVGVNKQVIRKIADMDKGEWENRENIEILLDPSYIGEEETPTLQYSGNLKLLGDIREKPKPFDPIKAAQNITKSINAELGTAAPVQDEAGNWIYKQGYDKRQYRKSHDMNADAAWDFSPQLQLAYPAEEGLTYSQEWRDIVWNNRKIPTTRSIIRAEGGGGFFINIGNTSTGLYKFSETEIEIPVIELGTNTLLPVGLSFTTKASRAIDINQLGGDRGKRSLSIFQPGFPQFKIDTDPKYLLEIRDKWYLMTTAQQYKAGKKDEKEGYLSGEMIKKPRDFFIPYEDVKSQLETWSKSPKGKGFKLSEFKFKDGSTIEGEEDTEYTSVKKVRNTDGQIINIGVRNGKWYNIDTGKIYK